MKRRREGRREKKREEERGGGGKEGGKEISVSWQKDGGEEKEWEKKEEGRM